jgi:hypothetical protein
MQLDNTGLREARSPRGLAAAFYKGAAWRQENEPDRIRTSPTLHLF